MRVVVLSLVAVSLLATHPAAEANDLESLVAAIKSVGPMGEGNLAATAAWKELAKTDAANLPELLAGLDDASPLAANWLRAAIDAIAERQLADGEELPAQELEAFVLNRSRSPRGRRLAFEWLARVDATAPDRLIPRMLQDPSVEFRRDAVARLLNQAEPFFEAEDYRRAKTVYTKALSGARDLDQVRLIAGRLEKMGEEVDLPRHFGFVTRWKVIGPFDNTNSQGFDVAYEPEEGVRLSSTHQGKSGEVAWIEQTTADDFGKVDLYQSIGKLSDVAGYATFTFDSPREQPVELRYTTVNASKLWLNGELLTANDVYHSGSSFDQYVGRGIMRKGKNVVLLKVLQNTMKEDWAQLWEFQLRVCDAAGTAILSTDPTLQTKIDVATNTADSDNNTR